MRCHRHPLRTRIRSRSVAESTPYVPSRNAERYKASNRRSFANAASGKTTLLAQNAKARLKTPRARLSSGHVNIRSTAMPGVPTTSRGRCASIRRAWSMRTIRTIRQKRTARAPWSRVKVITWCGEGARQESFHRLQFSTWIPSLTFWRGRTKYLRCPTSKLSTRSNNRPRPTIHYERYSIRMTPPEVFRHIQPTSQFAIVHLLDSAVSHGEFLGAEQSRRNGRLSPSGAAYECLWPTHTSSSPDPVRICGPVPEGHPRRRGQAGGRSERP